MSLGSSIIKGVVLLGLLAGVGYSVTSYNTASSTYNADKSQLAQTKADYKSELKKAPTTKSVTTAYQRAVTMANKYLKLDTTLHSQTDAVKRDSLLKQLQAMRFDGDKVSGPMVSYDIKDWTATVEYGGQDVQGRVMMTYKFVNGDGKLMKLVTFYYNVNSKKLSGFSTYMSKAGSLVVADKLRG